MRFTLLIGIASHLLLANHILHAQPLQTEGYAVNDGVKIYYRTFGEGNPVVIINGGPGMSSEGFAALAQELSPGYKTIIFDQRGTGKSELVEVNNKTISMNLMVKDLEAIRKSLHIDKWHVLGHSFGGMMASYYATQHPDNINSIILSSSGGIDLELLSYIVAKVNSKLSQQALDSIQYWNNRISNGDTSMVAKIKRGTLMAPAYVFNKNYHKEVGIRLAQGNYTINFLVWSDLRDIKFDCAKDLAGFTKPVLIIQGKQDIIEERTAIKAGNAYKNSKVVLLDNCSHYGWLDRPDAYLPEIKRFLEQANIEAKN